MDSQSNNQNTSAEIIEEERLCPICYDSFKKEVITGCNHSFCDACIWDWILICCIKLLKFTCPYCRQYLHFNQFRLANFPFPSNNPNGSSEKPGEKQ